MVLAESVDTEILSTAWTAAMSKCGVSSTVLPLPVDSIGTTEQSVNMVQRLSANPIHQSHPEGVSSTLGTPETGERKGLIRVLVFEKHSYSSVGSNGIDLCYLKAMGHPVREKTFFLRLYRDKVYFH